MGKKWLLKSEPNVWSIEQQKKVGAKGAIWDGVRNYQAANNLKQMKKGGSPVRIMNRAEVQAMWKARKVSLTKLLAGLKP